MLTGKIKKYIKSKKYREIINFRINIFNKFSDKLFLKQLYKCRLGKQLNLGNPSTFNEKIQWLKLYDRNPIYTQLVDKYEAKKVIALKIGAEHVIPTLGVWNKFDQINFDTLPDQFVLKCTHDSGGLIICKDKKTFDKQKAKEKINKSLKTNYYWCGREWPYKKVKPRIIAEQYMEDNETKELRDYKFFCFNGVVKCFKVDFDRQEDHRANYYEKDKNLLPFGEAVCPPDFAKEIILPKDINVMIDLAEKLATDIPFVRVDLYYANSQIYFGELTFYPASGFGKFIPEEWDDKLGNWLILPKKIR